MPAVSKALALEYAANNIRFNTGSPGNIDTPLHAKDNHAALAKFHPLARMGEISDVVDAVLYLQNATFVTGENIRVDVGFHDGGSNLFVQLFGSENGHARMVYGVQSLPIGTPVVVEVIFEIK